MKFNSVVLSVIISFVSFGSSSSSAGIVLSFAPTSPSQLLAGSSGSLDVLIHSDAADMLDAFLVEFILTPIGPSPVGGVEFSAMQLDSQLTEFNYVFFGNSLSFETSQSVGTVIGGEVFRGYDATFDFTPVILSGTEQLLVRLNLDGVTAGSYSIGVLSATFLKDQLLADPSDLGFPDNLVPYSSTLGEITVAGTTAVPEPSSGELLGLAIAISIFYVRKTPRLARVWICRQLKC